MQHIRFDPTVNFGQAITAAAFALSLMGMVWWESDFQATTKERLVSGEVARQKYVPVIEGIAKSQDVTNSRLENVAAALREVRDANRDVTEATSKIRERLSAIEAILDNKPKQTGSNEFLKGDRLTYAEQIP
jgi:hypothetical protein